MYRHDVPFSDYIWLVTNIFMHHIAICTLEHLEITSNDPHGYSRIRINNLLYPLYRLCALSLKKWMLFYTSLQATYSYWSFQLLLHKNIATSKIFPAPHWKPAAFYQGWSGSIILQVLLWISSKISGCTAEAPDQIFKEQRNGRYVNVKDGLWGDKFSGTRHSLQ